MRESKIKIPKGTLINIDGKVYILKKSLHAISDGKNVFLLNEEINTDMLKISKDKIQQFPSDIIGNGLEEVKTEIPMKDDKPYDLELMRIAYDILCREKSFNEKGSLDYELRNSCIRYLRSIFVQETPKSNFVEESKGCDSTNTISQITSTIERLAFPFEGGNLNGTNPQTSINSNTLSPFEVGNLIGTKPQTAIEIKK